MLFAIFRKKQLFRDKMIPKINDWRPASRFVLGISTICANFMNFFLFWEICNKLLHKLGQGRL